MVNYASSVVTTDTDLTHTVWSTSLGTGRTAVVMVNYFGIAANGKRISGNARGVITNVAGTLSYLATQIDPYLQKDAAGFPDNAVQINISGTTVTATVTGVNGQGDTYWTVEVNYILA
ncbi:MAG TPA: hypothetical protein VFS31_12760 [Chitinophagaceae bacterium]|nr:hypothetical protein [Chitinophagaceae bacterium]